MVGTNCTPPYLKFAGFYRLKPTQSYVKKHNKEGIG